MSDPHGSALTIGVLTGDGIGVDIVPGAVAAVDAAFEALGVPAVRWARLPFGRAALDSTGSAVPDSTLAALEDLPAWICGPHDNASYPSQVGGVLAPGGTLRRHFGLYANIRPARALPSVQALSPNMDLVIVRENTEGFYADRNMARGSGEFMPTPDVALAVAVFTRTACERIAHEAFAMARSRSRRVTIAHKANVLAMTTGLFRDACLDVAREYPDVQVRTEHIDALAAHLVRSPAEFDVIVAENMFGDILSDLTAELSGSLGTAPSINTSATKVMAQAAHGAAPELAGKNRANPIALMLSASMMLDRLGAHGGPEHCGAAAAMIDLAVRETVASGVATVDLGGLASTREVVEHVVARIHHLAMTGFSQQKIAVPGKMAPRNGDH